jgi:uncharacterized HAD superfamily protein
VLIAVDIDGTIASDPGARNHARFMNKTLNLGISHETISTLDSVEEFMCLPEVRAWKAQGGSIESFKAAWDEAQYDIELQLDAVPTSGAVVGVQGLAEEGTIIYITCRKEESRATTQEWLARYGFPNPERVYFCQDYSYKFIRAFEQSQPDERVLMIDDHMVDILKCIRMLSTQPHIMYAVLNRFSFACFGKSEVPYIPEKLKSKVKVVALPNWQEVLIAS